MQRIIIGLVGQIGAGKQEVVNYLRTRGFSSFSLSDVVRDEARKQGIENFTRRELQNVGDDLRKKFGMGVLAKRVYRKIVKQKARKVIIDSIRNPSEVNFLKTKRNFFLVGIKASKKARFERVTGVVRDGDSGVEKWKEFLKADRRDWGVGQKRYGQQVGRAMKTSDFLIRNDKGSKELYEQIERVLSKIFLES